MNAPGKGLLKVSGILTVIFTAIGIASGIMLLTVVDDTVAEFALMGKLISVGTLTTFLLCSLVASLFMFCLGIMAILGSTKVEKSKMLFMLGIIAVVLVVINLILNFVMLGGPASWADYVGFTLNLLLPILITLGASKNKKVA